MKKKLKVEKAFLGKIMKPTTTQGRRVIKPESRRTMGGSPRPGVQQQGIQIINGVKQLPTVGPQPGTGFADVNPAGFRRDLVFVSGVRPGVQQPISPMQPSSQIDPSSPRSLPFASAVGPMQGVGDPRLGAPIIPGNQLQMQMRGPTQAMKKGGAVRGGRAEIKGLRPAKIT